MSKIAFLGLGAMGGRMAQNLLAGGCQLTVWNRTPKATHPLIRNGAISAKTPMEAASDADFVITMVRDNEASHDIWLNPDYGVINSIPKHAVAIESSTVSLSHVRHLVNSLAEKNIPLLDAPVCGSRPQAENGQLIFTVGGDIGCYQKAKPLLNTMGAAHHHIGPSGHGMLLKLVINTFFASQMATLAELLGLLRKSGLNVSQASEVLKTLPVTSLASTAAMQFMVSGNHPQLFPIELVEKDLAYTLDAALAENDMPSTRNILEIYQHARALGFGDENISAVSLKYL